jgi:hypothetical protein
MAKELGGKAAAFGAPVPDLFIDDIPGYDLLNNTIRLDLATWNRAEPIPPSEITVSVVGRAIMPIETAQRLCVGLYDFLRQHGLDPNAAAGASDDVKLN